MMATAKRGSPNVRLNEQNNIGRKLVQISYVHHWQSRIPNKLSRTISKIFWEIRHLHDTKASIVIKKLKCHFGRHGNPHIVISNNGPQFACEKFRNFADKINGVLSIDQGVWGTNRHWSARQKQAAVLRGTPSTKSQRKMREATSCSTGTKEHSHWIHGNQSCQTFARPTM